MKLNAQEAGAISRLAEGAHAMVVEIEAVRDEHDVGWVTLTRRITNHGALVQEFRISPDGRCDKIKEARP